MWSLIILGAQTANDIKMYVDIFVGPKNEKEKKTK